jgi:hypothetical protein
VVLEVVVLGLQQPEQEVLVDLVVVEEEMVLMVMVQVLEELVIHQQLLHLKEIMEDLLDLHHLLASE